MSAEQYRSTIATMLADEMTEANVMALWLANEDEYPDGALNLVFFSTFQRAIEMAIGNLDKRMSQLQPGETLDRIEQRSSDLRFLHGVYGERLAVATTTFYGQVTSGPRIGPLDKNAPIESLPGYVDANSPYYYGHPQMRRPGVMG